MHTTKLIRWLPIWTGVMACHPASIQRQTPVASASQPGDIQAETMLAVVGGVAVERQHLGPDLDLQLAELNNEYEQRRAHAVWRAVEDSVGERLLAIEAKRRGVSVSTLVQNEIENRIKAPTDKDLTDYYEINRAYFDLPLRDVKDALHKRLVDEARMKRRRAFLDTLRSEIDVRYNLPAPSLPRFRVDASAAPALGPQGAAVTLLTFADYQSPYSALAHRNIKRLQEIYGKNLRVVQRDFPLDQHKNARLAARAAHCAHAQGKFWPYQDLLFEHPDALSQADLKRYAKDLELDTLTFEQCLDAAATDELITMSVRKGRELGVDAAPVTFVNGMKLVGLTPLPLMQAIIERELRNQRIDTNSRDR